MNAAWRNLILLIVLIISGVSGGFYFRNQSAVRQNSEREKFISTYAELLAAKAISNKADDSIDFQSRAEKLTEINERNGTDSIWMRKYLESQSGDVKALENIWGIIELKTDSILAETKRQKAILPK